MFNKTTVSDALSECKFKQDIVTIRVTKFNEDSAKKFFEDFNKSLDSHQPVIPIVIDSYGGYVDSLLSMVSCIQSADRPVATIVQGKAMSCGSVLMSCGTPGYRYIDPNARVMIHEVGSMSWGKVSDIDASTKESKRLNRQLFTLMAKNAGKPKKYFIEQMKQRNNADWYLSPKQSLTEGLADFVGVPQLTREVEVAYKLTIGGKEEWF